MNFLQMSLSGAVFIIAMVILRAVAVNRLPKTTFPVLWELVLLRLLIPFSIPSAFSLYTILTGISETKAPALMPAISQASPAAMQAGPEVNPAQPFSPWFTVWCIGVVFFAAFFAFLYLRCRKEFQTSCPIQEPYAKHWLQEHPLRRPLAIRTSDRISTPLSYGVFHPVILMPQNTDWQDTDRLQYILLHEYTHIRRFDTAVKLVMVTALCLHWFNPCVWAMYFLMNHDLELCCDECVIRHFGEASRAAYARMLIDMCAEKSSPAPLCNTFNTNAIKERITAIMKMKRKTIVTTVLSCLVIVAAAGIFATSAAASDSQTELAFYENYAVADEYAVYNPYGLTVDDGKLYYENQLVRCFDDQYPTKNFSIKAVGYYEKTGTVDIRALRDGDYKLTGIEALSEEAFQNREINTLSRAAADSQVDVTVTRQTSGSTAAMFADYEAYGLHYDESKKALFYDDQRVRLFWDSTKSAAQPEDSEKAFTVSVSNWDEEGEVDLYAVRNFTRKESNGYGALSGLRMATTEEFEKNTRLFGNQTGVSETAE